MRPLRILLFGCAAACLPDFVLSSGGGDGGGDAGAEAGCTIASLTDPNNCGACGHACTADAGCFSGTCGNEALQVSAGYNSACAVMGDRALYCWGENAFGEIATSGAADVQCTAGRCRPVAQQVTAGDGGVKMQQVSVGQEFVCAVDTDNLVWCWGKNHRGQCGHSPSLDPLNGSIPYNYVPIRVQGLPAVSSVWTGYESACAVTTAGAMWCWGNDDSDQLDTSSPPPPDDAGAVFSSTPVKSVSLTSNVDKLDVAFTSAENHLCARRTDGTEWCWADNDFGERGSGAASGSLPSAVVGADGGTLTNITDIAVGKFSSCALSTGGALFCWGQNLSGIFGNPKIAMGGYDSPVPAASDTGAVAFSSISAHTTSMCGVTTTGAVYCWGDNSWGEVGNGVALDAGVPPLPAYDSVQLVPGLSARQVSSGFFFNVAIATDGTVWAWGTNSEGQCGHDQAPTDNNGCADYCTVTPTQVQGLPHP